MKLLLARLIYRYLGTRHVTVWGHDKDYALLGSEEDIVHFRVGRHWVVAWTYWWDWVGYEDRHIERHVCVYRFPAHAVRSINDRGWERE